MLKNVKIENFRGFRSFELQQLGRLNLLVGANNSGKTSLLEAIQLLRSRNNLEPLRDTMINRGEYFDNKRTDTQELNIRHLFYNHKIEPSSRFSISGINDTREEKFVASIGLRPIDQHFDPNVDTNTGPTNLGNNFVFDFTIEWIHENEREHWDRPLSYYDGLPEQYIRQQRIIGVPKKTETRTQFVTSSALTSEKMVELFDQIVLTPEENLVQEALQSIEPKIKRIAPISSEKYRRTESHEGFVVLLSDSDQRVPIGSMGDGIWRMLGLALATVGSSDGVLFVDEIDTGLHFSAMSNMWKLVWETAKRLNVQVFATTHSSDCWTSLASIADQEGIAEDGITIKRIERGKETGIAFSEREIVIAAQRGIEVR
ncbi:MAG: AAA family ATPase [Blastochloris sp.]|nr:AAA family ATPase [Blastochloris sp.]